ncbi:hypothetical protein EVAR_22363_1 [Eumeta japonica]|uniref:Uncharacterized protein n=1 Tax=Eumeta variegata TaxID=151549 RepID=A0A4C1VLG6_EUMVA|nr:hypothetical protein EVAR_22363_1 [Eumeta japonica]
MFEPYYFQSFPAFPLSPPPAFGLRRVLFGVHSPRTAREVAFFHSDTFKSQIVQSWLWRQMWLRSVERAGGNYGVDKVKKSSLTRLCGVLRSRVGPAERRHAGACTAPAGARLSRALTAVQPPPIPGRPSRARSALREIRRCPYLPTAMANPSYLFFDGSVDLRYDSKIRAVAREMLAAVVIENGDPHELRKRSSYYNRTLGRRRTSFKRAEPKAGSSSKARWRCSVAIGRRPGGGRERMQPGRGGSARGRADACGRGRRQCIGGAASRRCGCWCGSGAGAGAAAVSASRGRRARRGPHRPRRRARGDRAADPAGGALAVARGARPLLHDHAAAPHALFINIGQQAFSRREGGRLSRTASTNRGMQGGGGARSPGAGRNK